MDILLKDPVFIVVNKPGGLLSVPGRGPEKQDCVVNRIKKLFPDCLEQPSVHRLDMYTSGLMILALTKDAHRHLSRQFEERKVLKKYIALVEGKVKGNSGKIDLAFRLDINNRPYQVYDPVHGKQGISVWRKQSEKDGVTRVEFQPLTGRTHQLRLHASHKLGLGTPIVGDMLYGNGKDGEPMMLHAFYLGFEHPQSGKETVVTSVLPF